MTWQDDRTCRNTASDPARGNRWLSLPTHRHPRGTVNEWAIARCHECPVLEDCRDWVLSWDIDPCPFHVVGGMSIAQRQRWRDRNKAGAL